MYSETVWTSRLLKKSVLGLLKKSPLPLVGGEGAKGLFQQPAKRRALGVMLLAGVLCGPAAHAGLIDPTRPPDYRSPDNAAAASQPWVLTSTLISPARRLAVINGRVYAAGDVVAGARILAIEPYAVRLSKGGRVFTLRLLPGKVKRPHDNDKAVEHP